MIWTIQVPGKRATKELVTKMERSIIHQDFIQDLQRRSFTTKALLEEFSSSLLAIYHGVPLLLYHPINHHQAPSHSLRSNLRSAIPNQELQQVDSLYLLWHHPRHLTYTRRYWTIPPRPSQQR